MLQGLALSAQGETAVQSTDVWYTPFKLRAFAVPIQEGTEGGVVKNIQLCFQNSIIHCIDVTIFWFNLLRCLLLRCNICESGSLTSQLRWCGGLWQKNLQLTGLSTIDDLQVATGVFSSASISTHIWIRSPGTVKRLETLTSFLIMVLLDDFPLWMNNCLGACDTTPSFLDLVRPQCYACPLLVQARINATCWKVSWRWRTSITSRQAVLFARKESRLLNAPFFGSNFFIIWHSNRKTNFMKGWS